MGLEVQKGVELLQLTLSIMAPLLSPNFATGEVRNDQMTVEYAVAKGDIRAAKFASKEMQKRIIEKIRRKSLVE